MTWLSRFLASDVAIKLVSRLAARLLRPSRVVRPTCELCCLKHLAQARVELLEAKKGYAALFWCALGHLAEAEDEIVEKYPAIAERIRSERKALERRPDAGIDLPALIEEIAAATGLQIDPGGIG